MAPKEMLSKTIKLIRSGPKTSWTYRHGDQFLVDLDTQNVCGDFHNAKSASETAHQQLATDPEGVFYICDEGGMVVEKVFDKEAQERKRDKENILGGLLLCVYLLLCGFAYFQFLGMPLMPAPLYLLSAIVALAGIIYCIVEFPTDTKVILIVMVTALLWYGHNLRQEILRKQQSKPKQHGMNQHFEPTGVALQFRSHLLSVRNSSPDPDTKYHAP